MIKSDQNVFVLAKTIMKHSMNIKTDLMTRTVLFPLTFPGLSAFVRANVNVRRKITVLPLEKSLLNTSGCSNFTIPTMAY